MEALQLKKMLFKTFGEEYYTKMYNFFLEFSITEKYEYKIIKTRRAFVLYQLFLQVFEDQYKKQYDASFIEEYDVLLERVYNDCLIGNECIMGDFKGKKLLIIDDILIHGRALNSFVDNLFQYGVEDISVAVLMYNKTAECVKENLNAAIEKITNEKLRFSTCSQEKSWEEFSNKIVYAIQQSGICYSAFVPQYRLKSSPFFVSLDKYIVIEPNKLQMQKRSNLNISIYKETTRSFNNFRPILRKYSYECGDQIIVPFVILPQFEVKCWIEINNSFFFDLAQREIISEDEKSLFIISEKNEDNYIFRERIKYSYRLMTYLISCLYLLFVTRDSSEKLERIQTLLMSASFGKPIFNILNNIENKMSHESSKNELEQIMDAFEKSLGSKIYDSVIRNESLDIFYHSISDIIMGVDINNIEHTEMKKNIDSIIQEYIDRIHQTNEKRALEKESRLEGAYFYSMINVMENYYKFDDRIIDYFIARMCSKWDSGITSYIVDIHSESSYVGGCIIDGEQAYHEVIPYDSNDEVNCFYEILRRVGGKIQIAIYEYQKLMDFVKDNHWLDVNKMQSIIVYLNRNHSIDALKESVYPETFCNTNVRRCILNYRKGEFI